MKINEIKKLHDNFNEQLKINYRLNSLERFKQTIIKYENEIYDALYQDLGKSKKESFLSEINESIEEIEYHIKNLKKWSKPKKVKSSYKVMGTKSYVINKPKGKVLLIVPFNYPLNLCFLPLIGAISAGNKVLIKMSSLTPNTANMVNKIINEAFSDSHVSFFNEKLNNYDELFDYEPNMVFFTGSTKVGKEIEMKCVQRNIEYITELGGECPCVVYDLKTDAIFDRIVWAKFMNAGQTCVSINYVLYNNSIVDFEQKLIASVKKQYPDALINKNVPKLVSKKAFDKMVTIINENKNNIILGGGYDSNNLIVEPTIIKVNQNTLKKYGEIFGPILLICPMNGEFNEYTSLINAIDNSPLAAYLYSSQDIIRKKFINDINAGGYCINDSMSHITNHYLPFGGVYTSGSGKYHGHYSFESFSFIKGVLVNDAKKNNNIKFINNHIDLQKTKKMIKFIKKFKK